MKDGTVVQIDTPADIVENPANLFVRDFLGIQRQGVRNKIDLETLIVSSEETAHIPNRVPSDATLEEVLEKLAEHEHLAVEKDGEAIGIIDRRTMIEYMANQLNGRGLDNE